MEGVPQKQLGLSPKNPSLPCSNKIVAKKISENLWASSSVEFRFGRMKCLKRF